jgi:anti-sigma factor RsiW
MSGPMTEQDLHAYADGQLEPSRLTQVEAWLAAHPERRAQVEAWRQQSAGLHRLYDAVLDEPIPVRLMAPGRTGRGKSWRSVAAAVAGLAVGGVIGFFLRGDVWPGAGGIFAAASLPRQAAVAHAVYVPEVRHPVEVGADQEAHLVGWLSKRLGKKLDPPRLDEAGYRLMGGRLLPGESGEVAQFMYENDTRNRLTLYVQPQAASAADTTFRYAREGGIDVFYWIDGNFGYALSGNTGREDMLRLATLVFHQQGR